MHIVATTFVSINTSHIRLSMFPLSFCVFSMIMAVSQVIIIKPYCTRVIQYMHHAHTGKILEAPIFYVGGGTVVMVTAK